MKILIVEFEKLKESNLICGAIYKGGDNNFAGEVISKLMNCENSSGFRKKGDYTKKKELKYVILNSTGKHLEWKDSYNEETNEFLYYGDQDKPGKDICDTRKKGNEILKLVFERLKKGNRSDIPPFFVFMNQAGRDKKFIGLAVPGSRFKNADECLEEITIKKTEGLIKNYKSIFTILNVSRIDRRWLYDLDNNLGYESEYVPKEWIEWITNGYKGIEPKEIIDNDVRTSSEDINELDYIVNNIDDISFELEFKEIKSGYPKQSNLKVKNNKVIKKSTKQYIDEYKNKQYIGIIGESIIYKHEKGILQKSEIKELREKANDVEWSSKDKGDGLGYDIKSYDIINRQVVEKYIEVKTTVSQNEHFEVTPTEVENSKKLNDKGIYAVARVYNLDVHTRKASYYYDYGKIEDNYSLEPKLYIAIRKYEDK